MTRTLTVIFMTPVMIVTMMLVTELSTVKVTTVDVKQLNLRHTNRRTYPIDISMAQLKHQHPMLKCPSSPSLMLALALTLLLLVRPPHVPLLRNLTYPTPLHPARPMPQLQRHRTRLERHEARILRTMRSCRPFLHPPHAVRARQPHVARILRVCFLDHVGPSPTVPENRPLPRQPVVRIIQVPLQLRGSFPVVRFAVVRPPRLRVPRPHVRNSRSPFPA